jgi:hypothetical protein
VKRGQSLSTRTEIISIIFFFYQGIRDIHGTD